MIIPPATYVQGCIEDMYDENKKLDFPAQILLRKHIAEEILLATKQGRSICTIRPHHFCSYTTMKQIDRSSVNNSIREKLQELGYEIIMSPTAWDIIWKN